MQLHRHGSSVWGLRANLNRLLHRLCPSGKDKTVMLKIPEHHIVLREIIMIKGGLETQPQPAC